MYSVSADERNQTSYPFKEWEKKTLCSLSIALMYLPLHLETFVWFDVKYMSTIMKFFFLIRQNVTRLFAADMYYFKKVLVFWSQFWSPVAYSQTFQILLQLHQITSFWTSLRASNSSWPFFIMSSSFPLITCMSFDFHLCIPVLFSDFVRHIPRANPIFRCSKFIYVLLQCWQVRFMLCIHIAC